jgi:group II intron reverse transcriptase/maturase
MEPLLRNMKDTMKSENVYTKQQRIAALAQKHPDVSFTSLAYHIDVEWLAEAYRRTRKDGAAGVDGMTAQEYEKELNSNLQKLLDRFKSGTYVAPPVKRTYIPKGNGKQELRPIGIPTLEDKVLQRAIVMVLEPLYEVDFRASSYGFRPKRSAHQALEDEWQSVMNMRGCWVLEMDIEKFYDRMKHEHLREFVKQRVCDGVIIRTIGKWLNAGVLEKGEVHYPEDGSPQGGVISPVLSNIYLHEVLDKWFEDEIVPRLKSSAKLIRFADDALLLFKNREDAERVMKVIGKRFARFGLTLHKEKTQLVDFTRPRSKERGAATFDFLGFTHYWGKSRKGNHVLMRRTSRKKLKGAIGRVYDWCRKNRHNPIKEQWCDLKRKVIGHYGYYGITFNMEGIRKFEYQVRRSWQKWLNRRARENVMPWEKFNALLKRYPIPRPRIVHSYI